MDNRKKENKEDGRIDPTTMIQSGFGAIYSLFEQYDKGMNNMMSHITSLYERITALEKVNQPQEQKPEDAPKQILNDPNAPKQQDPLSQLLAGLMGGGKNGS